MVERRSSPEPRKYIWASKLRRLDRVNNFQNYRGSITSAQAAGGAATTLPTSGAVCTMSEVARQGAATTAQPPNARQSNTKSADFTAASFVASDRMNGHFAGSVPNDKRLQPR
jgi:hypothetical protein